MKLDLDKTNQGGQKRVQGLHPTNHNQGIQKHKQDLTFFKVKLHSRELREIIGGETVPPYMDSEFDNFEK